MAAYIACYFCLSQSPDDLSIMNGALPTMMPLLAYNALLMLESAKGGFNRLAGLSKASCSGSEKLETLCGDESNLVENVLRPIVQRSHPAISP